LGKRQYSEQFISILGICTTDAKEGLVSAILCPEVVHACK